MQLIRMLPFLVLLAIAAVVLAACSDSIAVTPSAVAPATAGATANTSTASAPTARVPATSVAGAGAISDRPNDTTQARLRVSQCVMSEPPMDVYMNGKVPIDVGMPLPSLGALDASRYEYLAPGTYSLAVAPSGQGLSNPLLGPMDVTVAAGHRYTVVVLGQQNDTNHKGLVIDETAAYQAIGAKPTDHTHITVNNIKGVPGINFALAGQVKESNATYGGFAAAIFPAGFVRGLTVTVSGSPDKVLDSPTDEVDSGPSGSDFLDCYGGSYPGTIGVDFDTHSTGSTSALNSIDFLQLLTDEVSKGVKYPSFNTFLSALKTTGLRDMLAGGGPYLIFAPTDDAFASLPKVRLDALMADPAALEDVLRYSILEGYYPPFTMSRPTSVNLRGDKLDITGGEQYSVNGEPVAGGGDTVMLANGTRVIWTSKVMLPPTQTPAIPGAAPTPTATGVTQFIGHIDGSELPTQEAGNRNNYPRTGVTNERT